LKDVLKSLIRNFIRRPAINLINLLGLSISMTMVVILAIYCFSELTTDNYHKNGDRVYLYRKNFDAYYTPGILKDQIDTKIPNLESIVRVAEAWERPVFQSENREPITTDLVFADVDFFKLFTYEAAEGTVESALNDPMTVVLTKSLSSRLFGNESAIGKTIKVNNSISVTVSAVIEEPKANTCLRVSAVTSMATRKIMYGEGQSEEFRQWGWNNFQTFLLLNKGNDTTGIAKTIQMALPEDQKQFYKDASLLPLAKVYFSRVKLFGTDYIASGDKMKVMILLMVAVLVLLIALVNFINITSSQWFERIRQTGIMKILGAGRIAIFRNIIVESFLLFLAAFLIALNLISTLYPFLKNHIGIQFNQKIIFKPGFIAVTIICVLLLSLIFSIIPAIRISGSHAIDNLKKTVKPNKKSFRYRGVLVTTQFIISIVLIAFTILVQKQVRYGTSELGINQENILGIKLTEQLNRKREVLKNLLESKSFVRMVSFSDYFPGEPISNWGTQMILNGEKKQVKFDTFSADPKIFKMLGLELVQGRFYSSDMPTDNRKIIVNEAFLRENNVANPVGGNIIEGMMGHPAFLSEIIGIVKDFHYKAVNQPIAPLVIRNDSSASFCLLSINTEDFRSLHSAVEEIKRNMSELSPSFPVEITFLDLAVRNMYLSELQFRRIFSLFAGCAIILCCLGILAMSLSECNRRIKEIGIRKVNGARSAEIMFMLNRDFIKWVLVAFMISIPISIYLMHKWLLSFVYKTSISWWIFILAGVLAFIIALVTISWQSWRAAARNPVEALRYE
jgi:putative ABC transport system permease protein